MMTTTSSNLEYFAAIPEEEHERLANEMMNKIRIYREWLAERGLITLWEKKLRNYYGQSMGGNSSQAITSGGSSGELNMIKVNDLHSLVQEQLVIVTSQRPAGIAKAINSDTKSLKASRIGSAIAEYYMVQGGFEQKFVQAAEIALLCDESFPEVGWDKSAGDPIAVDPETAEPVMSGDAYLRVHCPWNAARDVGATLENNEWYILSIKVNKFDRAEKYPKFRDHIISVGKEDLPGVPVNDIPEGSDQIFEHVLIHDRTSSVKEGRYSVMIGGQIVLDSSLPFQEFPVSRMAPSDVIDGNLGYAPANDILALEEVTDALHSIVVTNQTKFGGQSIVGPIGANLKVTDLAKGSRYFEVEPDFVDKIKPLQLTQTPAEIFNYIGMADTKKGKAVGSVSGVLAQQAQQGASGNSMALIQTQAISYNSGTQRSYFAMMSSTMTKLIGVLRVYADTPRVASIVGKSKSAGLKEFKYNGNDLDSISTIVYEPVSPVLQTFGGRMDFADKLLQAGQIKSPKQYINLATTGQVDELIQDDEADGMLILEENEWLMEGRPFEPVITQMHADHIKSHTSQITLDAQEKDPEFVARVLDHIQKHVDIWQQASMMNPGILIATGQQPLMPPPGMMSPQGMPPQPGGPGPVPGNAPAVVQKGEGVKPPELPNIAGTKEKPTIPGVTDVGLG